MIEVAAIFQKDPQVIMSHPERRLDTLEDLAKAPTIFMGKDVYATQFSWMKATFPASMTPSASPTPSTRRRSSPTRSRSSRATSPPSRSRSSRQAASSPKSSCSPTTAIATYSTTIETQQTRSTSKPDVVQRFVDASTNGWYNYLYGDNKAANDLIKKDNPDMTDEQIAFSIKADEGLRHRRFGRRGDERHRRHDRCAL